MLDIRLYMDVLVKTAKNSKKDYCGPHFLIYRVKSGHLDTNLKPRFGWVFCFLDVSLCTSRTVDA